MKKQTITNSKTQTVENNVGQLQPISRSESSNQSLKISNYLRTISELQTGITKLQQQIQYCRQVQQWMSGLLAVKWNPGEKPLKSLLNASSKINLLESQAIFSVNKGKEKSQQASDKDQGCSVSAHLNYILRPKTDIRQRKAVFLRKREQMYKRIEETLGKQQPYLQEKIMKKIKRQAKRQTKLQAIRQLQKYCKSKQNWLGPAQAKINSSVDQKALQQKLSNNLSKMKEVLTKKILNNTYIEQIVSNKQNMDRNVQKLNKFSRQTVTKLKQQLQKMRDVDIDQQLQDIQFIKQKRQNQVEIDEQFIQDLKHTMGNGMSLLAMPLSSQVADDLLVRCEILQDKINGLINKKY